MTVDLALALEALLPGAQYTGSLTLNTPEQFGALAWNDARPKPDIEALLAYTAPPNPTEVITRAREAFVALPLALQAAYQGDVNNILLAITNGNPALGLKNLSELQPLEPAHAALIDGFKALFGLVGVAPVDSTVGTLDPSVDALLDHQAGVPFSG